MPNIKPVSDLRNYNEVLKNISNGEPVYLTRNGRGCFAIVTIEEYERLKSTLRLLSELSEGERSGKEQGWLSLEQLEAELGIDHD